MSIFGEPRPKTPPFGVERRDMDQGHYRVYSLQEAAVQKLAVLLGRDGLQNREYIFAVAGVSVDLAESPEKAVFLKRGAGRIRRS
jgi:hypothetical protein